MASRTTSLSGKIPKLKDSDAKRLAAYLLRGNDVVAQAPLQGDGSFRITLPRTALASKSAYALRVAIAPAGAGDHLEHVPNVQQVREGLCRARRKAGHFRRDIKDLVALVPTILHNRSRDWPERLSRACRGCHRL